MKLGKVWLLIALVFALGISACSDDDDIRVGSVKLNKEAVTLEIGQKDTLTVTIEPTNANNKNVVWKSEDTRIATVVDGVVVAIAEGATKVTATTVDGSLVATCNVTVLKDIEVGGVKLNKEAVTLEIGQKDTLTVTIEPTNAKNKNVVWKSEDTRIATVVDGVVVAIAEGVTKVTATTVDGNLVATCNVTVFILNGEYKGILKAVNEDGEEMVLARNVLLKLENATAAKVKITTQIDLDLSELDAGILSIPVTGELDVKKENDTYTISGLLPVKVEVLQQELSVEISGVIKTDGSIDLKMEVEGFGDWFIYKGAKK